MLASGNWDGIPLIDATHVTATSINVRDVGKILLRMLTGHTGSVNSVAFSPDARTLVSGSQDFTIKLWDVSSVNPARR